MINSKKTGVISNIILSIFYACFAWIPSVFGLGQIVKQVQRQKKLQRANATPSIF